MRKYDNWQLHLDSENILWLAIDRKDAEINTINEEVLEELNIILDDIVKSHEYKGLIIYSAKDKGFIAGADIQQFKNLDKPQAVLNFLYKGQNTFNKLAALKIPTLAMINGFCLGGGLELALACDYRIAADTADTRLGLPEVLLGIHPGWGGTVRLPRLIGGFKALSELILTGKNITPDKALKLGVIDEAVPLRQLRAAAIYYINSQPSRHVPSFWQRISNYPGVRSILANLIRAQLTKKVKEEHYPAPFAVIANWKKDGALAKNSQQLEADSIKQLISQNDTAKNLMRDFFLRERLKSFSKLSHFKAKQIHVIGAGVMGGDIAVWCALNGLKVTLQDRDYQYIAPVLARAHKLFKSKLRKPHLIKAAMDRLIPDVAGYGLATADVIIEAIFEDLIAKQQLFKKIELAAPQHALLATNTSSIPLEDIASALSRPSRLVGIHFFNPVAKMELVEVVHGKANTPAVVHDACAFVGQLGRLPLLVKSSPGFLINRVLLPYLMESVTLLDEGIPAEVIDQAAKDFGMVMGPVELADIVGLDICLAVARNLTQHYGGEVPQRLQQKVANGDLGKKSGKGFYTYKDGKKLTDNISNSNFTGQDIAHRLILRMVNEAASCLREGVVVDSDLLDAGMIFGTGFAPFRGGPMHYAQNFGNGRLNEMFQHLEARYGKRFKVDDSLI